MNMILLTGPSVEPVLLSEVREFLKVDGNVEDGLLARLIMAARQACENFTGRKLIHQQWQVDFNDWQGTYPYGHLSLPLSPMVSVDKLEVMGSEGWMIVDPGQYLLDKSSYRGKIIPADGACFPYPAIAVGGIRVSLTAGFASDWNALPEDLRQGIFHWIESRYEEDSALVQKAQKNAESLWQSYRMVNLS